MKLEKKEQISGNKDKVAKYYDEMLEICNKEIFANAPIIQSQKINILMKLADKEQKLRNEEKVTKYYDEMLEICNKEEFANNKDVQSQKINILMKLIEKEQKLGNKDKVAKYYDEILEICNKEIFGKTPEIQSQKITIIMKLVEKEQELGNKEKVARYYDEMLEICNKEIFTSNPIIQFQKTQIQEKKEQNLLVNDMLEKDSNIILNSIQDNFINLEEINSIEISISEQIIYTVAFYEKNNFSQKLILNYIKSKMKECASDLETLNILNKLKNKIIQNIRIFDVVFYQKLLDTLPNKVELEKDGINLKYINNI